MWYRALSVHYACIRSSGIILFPYATSVPNFVFFAASIAELAHGENLRTQSINHPAYLMPREPKLALWKKLRESDVTDRNIIVSSLFDLQSCSTVDC